MDPSNSEKKRKLNFALDRRHPTLTLNLTPVTVSGGVGVWSNMRANKRRVSVGGAFVVWKKGGKS